MNRLTRWLDERRRDEEQRVLDALGMLRPSKSFGLPIIRLARLGPGRTYVVLARLETAGLITSGWADMPPPRRRLYRLAKEATR